MNYEMHALWLHSEMMMIKREFNYIDRIFDREKNTEISNRLDSATEDFTSMLDMMTDTEVESFLFRIDTISNSSNPCGALSEYLRKRFK
jgi:hypothetical protein